MTPASTTVTADVSTCSWSAAIDSVDGAMGHVAVYIALTNTSTVTCDRPEIVAASAVDQHGAVHTGTDAGEQMHRSSDRVASGDRLLSAINSTDSFSCGEEPLESTSVDIELSDGHSVSAATTIDLACGFSFSQLGQTPLEAAVSTGGMCHWYASVVNHDGGGGREAIVIGFTNTGVETCDLPKVTSVTGHTSDGTTVEAKPGGIESFAAKPASPQVVPSDRVELPLTIASDTLCEPTPPARTVDSVTVTFVDGATTIVDLDGSITTGCMFTFGEVGSWD
ncbi:MAG: hypothetical protein AB7V43_14650 [Acidimicrobiia bacterium]